MTHHHDHDSGHGHDHTHEHHHDVQSNLSFDEKIIKLLDHWIKHNADHAETYKGWAKKVKENNMPEAGSLFEDAAEMTLLISKKFEEAIELISSVRP